MQLTEALRIIRISRLWRIATIICSRVDLRRNNHRIILQWFIGRINLLPLEREKIKNENGKMLLQIHIAVKLIRHAAISLL